MDFEYSARTSELRSRVAGFMDRHVLPQNHEWHRLTEAGTYPSHIMDPLKDLARSEGLWNFFLPGLRDHEPGTRLGNLEYAPLAEIMGRLPWASEVFNCNAPDTGNMELLHLFTTDHQYQNWLKPMLNGEIRSCFAMTEPDVPSSDPTNLQTSIRREGDEYVINGRKWFITGSIHPNCKFAIVMGVSDDSPNASPHKRHSMVIVPMDTPGLQIVRNLPIFQHLAVDGHCEICSEMCAFPSPTFSAKKARGLLWRKRGLGPAEFTIACGRSASARWRWN